MPWLPSMATCAFDPAMSCFHNRLSKGMDAFISRITAAGPSAKRPPHIALEPPMSSRTVIACLLGLMVAGCDKQSPAPEQAGNTSSGEVSSGEVTAAPAPEAPKPAGAVDRAHKGEAAPAL